MRTETPPTSLSQRADNGDDDDEREHEATPRPRPSEPAHVAGLQRSRSDDKRQAIRMALDIITAVSKGLHVPNSRHGNSQRVM